VSQAETMTFFRDRVHRLVDQLSDEELAELWGLLADLYYDFYMLRAIHAAKRTLKPGDTFTREEALRYLSLW
jgi:hypothetical protein